jgi:hypothetical protein
MSGKGALSMTVTREVRADGWLVRLDLRYQVMQLEVPEAVIGYRRARDAKADAPLLPTLPHPEGGPVSAATLLLKAKQFDDGLYAAVELAAQQGMGCFPGKASLLRSLASTLTADPCDTDLHAAALILAACELGGDPGLTLSPLHSAVRTVVEDFLQDELRSKPLGFYTWTPDLVAVFRQDRLLQGPLDPETAKALARALDRTADGWKAYDACLRLAACLTNPPAAPGLRDAGDGRAFFPPSRSHEVHLLEHFFANRPIPEGFDLMTELIRRVRSGKISLELTDRSGWYDYQTWSLGPLVVPDRMPESARLRIGERYRRYLEDLFRGALALARETHAKQLAGGRGGYAGPSQRPLWIYPDLTVEPLPSVYARRAICYRFVRSVLEEAFGSDALHRLHRLVPEGPCQADLAEELGRMERLFDGAAATSCRELGLDPTPGAEGPVRCFGEWRTKLASDANVSRDARMMVPVFYDLQRRKTKVWALLGWRTVPVDVEFRVPPTALAVEPAGPPGPEATDRLSVLRKKFRKAPEKIPAETPRVQFDGARYEFAVPVMAEVYVEKVLDRDEFRRHCDRYRTRSAILANLP